MNHRRALMVETLALAIILFLVLSPITSSYAQSSKPITLNFVSFVPLADKIEYQSCKRMFIDKVNERAKGELKINVRGGPEVIRPFDLGVSVLIDNFLATSSAPRGSGLRGTESRCPQAISNFQFERRLLTQLFVMESGLFDKTASFKPILLIDVS